MTTLGTVFVHLLAATRPDALVFVWTSVVIIAGAIGVVISRNPVHSALMLVMTLFGVAVIFIELQANFLAAVQVIVYAGAIVVLFLFVIMLLGVDKVENIESEPLRGQRPIAIALVALALAGVLALGIESHWAVGAHAVAGARNQNGGDVAALGRSVFTTYLFPFEVTAALLVIAVVGAVVLSRQTPGTKSSDPDAGASPTPDSAEGNDPSAETSSSAAEGRGSAGSGAGPETTSAEELTDSESAKSEANSAVARSALAGEEVRT